MARIVSVWLPDWPIERLCLHSPGKVPAHAPFALVDTAHTAAHGRQDNVGRKAGSRTPADRVKSRGSTHTSLYLTAVNLPAREAGLAVGMALADARAMVPRLATAPAEPNRDRASLVRLVHWLGRYGPSHNCDAADSAWIDVTGVPHLFGGETALVEDLLRRLAAHRVKARIGLAGTYGAAHALAHFRTSPRHPSAIIRAGAVSAPEAPEKAAGAVSAPEAPSSITSEALLKSALAELPVAALRLKPEAIELLERLGLRRIGELYGLPRVGLERRFRDQGTGRRRSHTRPNRQSHTLAGVTAAAVLLRLDQALGLSAEPLTPLAAPPETNRHLVFAEPLISADAIGAALARLASDVCRHLESLSLGGRSFSLALYRIDGTVAEITARTRVSGRDPAHIRHLIARKLEHIDAGFGIDLMRLGASGLEPFAGEQTTLASGHRNARAVDELIDRLSNRLGVEAVICLEARESHTPERREMRVPALWRPRHTARVTGHIKTSPRRAPRPLLLLDPPEPVTVIAEIPDGAPARLLWRRVQRHIVRAEGPERIAPEWWRTLRAGAQSAPEAQNKEASAQSTPEAHNKTATDAVSSPRTTSEASPVRSARSLAAATRDYYRLEDAQGRGYWVFRRGLYDAAPEDGDQNDDIASPRWFLQGLFA